MNIEQLTQAVKDAKEAVTKLEAKLKSRLEADEIEIKQLFHDPLLMANTAAAEAEAQLAAAQAAAKNEHKGQPAMAGHR